MAAPLASNPPTREAAFKAAHEAAVFFRRRDINAEEETWNTDRALAAFQPQALDHVAALLKARTELAGELPNLARRRDFHLRLAYMIATKVLPKYGMGRRDLMQLPQKLSNCRMAGKVGTDQYGDKQFFWEHKCNLGKCCPDEMRTEAERISERYIPAIIRYLAENPRDRLHKCVISPRNVPAGQLHEAKRALFRAYSNVLRQKDLKKEIFGSLVVQEDPLAGGDTTWNVHLNVLLIGRAHINYRLFRERIATEYRRLTGDTLGQIEWAHEDRRVGGRASMRELTKRQMQRRGEDGPVTRVRTLSAAIHEMVKYVYKIVGSDHESKQGREAASRVAHNHEVGGSNPSPATNEPVETPTVARPMDEWPPAAWFEWYQANRGFRRTRTYGCLYNVPEPEADQLTVEWFARLQFDLKTGRYKVELADALQRYVDLIPADKFAAKPAPSSSSTSPRGPP